MKTLILLLISCLMVGCGKDDPVVEKESAASTIKSVTNCSQPDSGAGISLVFLYQIVSFSDGDLFVSCTISDIAASYTQSSFLKSSQTSAETSLCQITYDIDTFGSGSWQFRNVGGTKQVSYSDVGSARNGYSFNFSTCSTL